MPTIDREKIDTLRLHLVAAEGHDPARWPITLHVHTPISPNHAPNRTQILLKRNRTQLLIKRSGATTLEVHSDAFEFGLDHRFMDRLRRSGGDRFLASLRDLLDGSDDGHLIFNRPSAHETARALRVLGGSEAPVAP